VQVADRPPHDGGVIRPGIERNFQQRLRFLADDVPALGLGQYDGSVL
jgi:hypothetical protein